MNRLLIGLTVLGMLSLPASTPAATWNVPADALTIQAGIDSASAGDTVLVACGTYYEIDISMKSGVCLLSETGEAGCVVVDGACAGRVFYCGNVDSTATIQGFTITRGCLGTHGSGMKLENSSPSVVNCIFLDNEGITGAGMANLDHSSPTVTNCIFQSNAATMEAGGMFNSHYSSPRVSDCYFTGNSASGSPGEGENAGGMMNSTYSSPEITNCIFANNWADSTGGGMVNSNHSSPVIIGCTFSNNHSGDNGGGMFNIDSSPIVTACTFSDNPANARGGAICSYNWSAPLITDCSFSNNSAGDHGGGMCFVSNCNPILVNCTFYGNSAATVGNALSTSASVVYIEKSIIAFGSGGHPVSCFSGGGVSLLCCNVYGNAGGDWVGCIAGQSGINGNFSADPLFCDADVGDLRLGYESPCVDGGACGQVGAFGPACGLRLTSIADVGNDQGRNLRVRWNASIMDVEGSPTTINTYALWRRIDQYLARGGNMSVEGIQGGRDYPPGEWECVMTVPASGEDDYTTVSPTLCDSTATGGICWSVFFVRAYTESPFTYFDSPPDSGYSVDNLEPQAPQGIIAQHSGTDAILSWDPNEEEDLNYYAIYRGMEEGFEPTTPIGYTIDPYYEDSDLPAGGEFWYKITAVDFAGNESDPSAPVLTGVEEEVALPPTAFFLGPAVPNPFNPSTEIRYGIPAGSAVARVVLRIYDARGREIREVLDEEQGPGTYCVVWDGADKTGRAVASGMYFYRIAWNGRSETRRMVLLK